MKVLKQKLDEEEKEKLEDIDLLKEDIGFDAANAKELEAQMAQREQDLEALKENRENMVEFELLR